ncbi:MULTISPECIES: hypothetical protein [unclassified Streptomyces]|uniref:hypothetical protein n=1 Tax=unclassified Streptomyces TaxID=2593676 RepID=UPI00225404BC|nr:MULTISPECIES: hypothetical protein [unclassified Streptomyces]MCX4799827.1 hypothetical protein [Streptomyces sp. NBC_01242]WSJ41411.1 hypothetical protein OG772_37245 [Streptomyces sp. NBC_01321]WSP67782.1 hypothetical protein OG466_39110 [Streptomyces sp. NBC_01240]
MHEHEEVFHPWGTVSPAFWGAPALAPAEQPGPQRVPEVLRERLAAIATTAAEGRLQDATWMAYELDTEIAAKYGAEHLNVVHIREVRGHLAHLVGDHATALGWYLHTARLRATIQGPRHPDTDEATRRVYSLWRTVPTQDAHRLGTELLNAVTDIHGPDAPVALRTRRRLNSLAPGQASATEARS